MNAFDQMLGKYDLKTTADYEAAIREIIQEICLLGLWRGKFFEHAAFYGGTALRLFYGLGRFSEDLDFSLLKPENDFHLSEYFQPVKLELEAFGFNVRIEEKNQGAIESAFVKTDTRSYLIQSKAPEELIRRIHRDQVLKVKFEVDTSPPGEFEVETRYLLRPIPFSVKIYSPSSLFAGKMHALLCRQWQGRVKGRDWYDLIFYVSRSIPLNIRHLRERLVQTGQININQPFGPEEFREMVRNSVEKLDVEQAKKDVFPFVKDTRELEGWSKDLFLQVTRGIVIE